MILRGIISALLLVALTLASFGHQSLSPSDKAQAEAYILAGGDWADLCSEDSDPFATVAKCMACIIAQGCAVPDPSDVTLTTQSGSMVVWPLQPTRLTIAKADVTHPARAPPFV